MSKVKLYNPSGEATAEVELNSKIFGVEKVKPEVVHQVVVGKLANMRAPIASTKTRGKVRGGGKKPWQQKGTGRARAGSIRSPLWRGGGITFGPTSARNFARKINKPMQRLAIFAALTAKAKENKIFVIDRLELAEPKTKELLVKLQDLSKKMSDLTGKILMIVPDKEEKLMLASRNLPKVKMARADRLNILDILNATSVIIFKDALPVMEKMYLRTKELKEERT